MIHVPDLLKKRQEIHGLAHESQSSGFLLWPTSTVSYTWEAVQKYLGLRLYDEITHIDKVKNMASL